MSNFTIPNNLVRILVAMFIAHLKRYCTSISISERQRHVSANTSCAFLLIYQYNPQIIFYLYLLTVIEVYLKSQGLGKPWRVLD